MAEKILVYDDDADILEVCATILRMKGYEVFCRDNCRSLLEDIDTFSPNAILMDNWLPDTGGVKAVQLIKSNEKYKSIPVIFFSANSHVEELAKEAGADYMLKKPFDLRELQQIISVAILQNADL